MANAVQFTFGGAVERTAHELAGISGGELAKADLPPSALGDTGLGPAPPDRRLDGRSNEGHGRRSGQRPPLPNPS